jgi:hypothetical protein
MKFERRMSMKRWRRKNEVVAGEEGYLVQDSI